jgi:hypothetical protein
MKREKIKQTIPEPRPLYAVGLDAEETHLTVRTNYIQTETVPSGGRAKKRPAQQGSDAGYFAMDAHIYILPSCDERQASFQPQSHISLHLSYPNLSLLPASTGASSSVAEPFGVSADEPGTKPKPSDMVYPSGANSSYGGNVSQSETPDSDWAPTDWRRD